MVLFWGWKYGPAGVRGADIFGEAFSRWFLAATCSTLGVVSQSAATAASVCPSPAHCACLGLAGVRLERAFRSIGLML